MRWNLTVVTVPDHFGAASCYAASSGRDRPEAVLPCSAKSGRKITSYTDLLRISLQKDRIADVVGETSTAPVQLSATERDAVVQLIKFRLNVNVEEDMPWNAPDAPEGLQSVSGWELVPSYVADDPCLVFSACATAIWKFTNGEELLRFLRETHGFEFYVCDAAGTYLLCFNDHNFLIGWGASGIWVRQIKIT